MTPGADRFSTDAKLEQIEVRRRGEPSVQAHAVALEIGTQAGAELTALGKFRIPHTY